MQSNVASAPTKSEPTAVVSDVTVTTASTPGEVQIAGRRYVTAGKLAALLGVTVRTLCRWDAARVGAPKTKIGKTTLYNLESVAVWLASRETEPVRASIRRR